MNRHDYAYPFRIDGASGQAAQSRYEDHVDQMIRQILLTSPGERVNLPEFGCGVRRLLFAPNSDALDSTTQILVQQSLHKWLSDQIVVQKVDVSRSEDASELRIRINYTLIETRELKNTEVSIF